MPVGSATLIATPVALALLLLLHVQWCDCSVQGYCTVGNFVGATFHCERQHASEEILGGLFSF